MVNVVVPASLRTLDKTTVLTWVSLAISGVLEQFGGDEAHVEAPNILNLKQQILSRPFNPTGLHPERGERNNSVDWVFCKV